MNFLNKRKYPALHQSSVKLGICFEVLVFFSKEPNSKHNPVAHRTMGGVTVEPV